MSRRATAPRFAAAVAAVVAALATGAAPAAADVYDVTFDVRLDLHRESRTEWANFGTIAGRGDVAVALRGRVPRVRLDESRLVADSLGLAPAVLLGPAGARPLGLPPAGPPAEVTAASGGSEETTDGRVTGTCRVTGAQPVGLPRLLASHDPAALRFSPLEAIRVTRDCAGADGVSSGAAETTSWSGVDRDGPAWLAGPVVARVAPPAPGETRALRTVAATATLARCDREQEPDPSARCTATLAGIVTFTRVPAGAPPAVRPPRWPRPAHLRTAGSLDTRDNLFVFRVARAELDARLAVRAETRPAGQPPGWGALDMSLGWRRSFPAAVTASHGGWWGTRARAGRPLGGFWTARGQRFEWRGTAAYDRGVAERGTRAGREWTHASAACPDLRWRTAGRLSGAFLRAPGGRVTVTVRLPGIGRAPRDCGAVPLREEGLLDELSARTTIPASALRRARLVVPFTGERRTRARSGDGAVVRDLRIAGSVVLERADACRNPPEYPCAALFFASG